LGVGAISNCICQIRHCERSEAIHEATREQEWIASLRSQWRSSNSTYDFAISQRISPEFCLNIAPSEDQRAQGMPGARSARSLACKSRKHASKSPRSRRVARHSPRNGFNSCFALSPVTGLSCHRRLADTSATLDASVGASGPHDFAVRRVSALVRCAARVHRIPCPTSVTIAKRPSVWDGMARDMQVICVRRERKYF
jgi:hypothetical protein